MVDGERAVELQRLVSSRSVKPRTRSATEMRRGALRVRNHVLAWGARTYVMATVNVSPDSFSAGGDILNSIWGARDDVIEACVDTGAPLVVMHNKPVPVYERDVVDEVLAYLDDAASRCVRAGIPPEHVILDPGIGFGKLPEHNLVVLGALGRLVALGFPTLIGTSRKSTIGKLTGRGVEAREFGTAATVALAIAAGIDLVRVHDVPEQRDAVRVTDAIVRGWRPAGWTERLP